MNRSTPSPHPSVSHKDDEDLNSMAPPPKPGRRRRQDDNNNSEEEGLKNKETISTRKSANKKKQAPPEEAPQKTSSASGKKNKKSKNAESGQNGADRTSDPKRPANQSAAKKLPPPPQKEDTMEQRRHRVTRPSLRSKKRNESSMAKAKEDSSSSSFLYTETSDSPAVAKRTITAPTVTPSPASVSRILRPSSLSKNKKAILDGSTALEAPPRVAAAAAVRPGAVSVERGGSFELELSERSGGGRKGYNCSSSTLEFSGTDLDFSERSGGGKGGGSSRLELASPQGAVTSVFDLDFSERSSGGKGGSSRLELASPQGAVTSVLPRDLEKQRVQIPQLAKSMPTSTVSSRPSTATSASPRETQPDIEVPRDDETVFVEASLVTDTEPLNRQELVDQVTRRLKSQLETQREERFRQEQALRQVPVMAVIVDEPIGYEPTGRHVSEDGNLAGDDDDKACCLGFSRSFVLCVIGGFLLAAVVAAITLFFVMASPAVILLNDTAPPTATPTGAIRTSAPTSAPTMERICPPFTNNSTRSIIFDPDEGLVSVVGSTIDAPVNGLPSSSCSFDEQSPMVLYRFQATAAATVLIHTCSPVTNFDTILAVFRDFGVAKDCSDIACFGSNDDTLLFNTEICADTAKEAASVQSSIEITIGNPNDVFYIAVSGYSTFDIGNFELQFLALVGDWDPGTVAPSYEDRWLSTPAPVDSPTTARS